MAKDHHNFLMNLERSLSCLSNASGLEIQHQGRRLELSEPRVVRTSLIAKCRTRWHSFLVMLSLLHKAAFRLPKGPGPVARASRLGKIVRESGGSVISRRFLAPQSSRSSQGKRADHIVSCSTSCTGPNATQPVTRASRIRHRLSMSHASPYLSADLPWLCNAGLIIFRQCR